MALTLVLGLTARATIAAPRTWITQLRAATCCADHCPMKPARPLTPNRCCFVGSPVTDPATATVAATLERPMNTVLVFAPPTLPTVALGLTASYGTMAAVRAGPPNYLRSLTLRL